jgi:hypothetical protein
VCTGGGGARVKIVIRGNDSTWQYLGTGLRAGKQAHIASAVEELTARSQRRGGGAAITRASTLLIDDDIDNVRAALEHRACAPLSLNSISAPVVTRRSYPHKLSRSRTPLRVGLCCAETMAVRLNPQQPEAFSRTLLQATA